ncbi:MAG: hypothetical protein OHK0019_09080 [Saprospiraceae bacterium]
MRLFILLVFAFFHTAVFSQKMLLLERVNNPRPTKMYIGDELQYRIAGKEDYWYQRTITDMLPDRNVLLLDNFAVNLGDISQIKVRRKGIWRITGGALLTFGASLTLATTIAVLYKDEGTNFGALYGTAAGSFGIGYFLSTKRTLKLGKKHRLRLIEIALPQPPKQ